MGDDRADLAPSNEDDNGLGQITRSPPRPSYSPFTPTLAYSGLASENTFSLPPSIEQSTDESRWMDQPSPTIINLQDNSDAIALRSAISILQMQRQQAIRDIRTLDRMRSAAKANPQVFLDDLKSGRLSKDHSSGIDLDESDSETGDDKQPFKTEEREANTGQFPNPQNVVRCPPVEWSKYHIVGEALDQIHERQQRNPGIAEESVMNRISQPPAHLIAAPYRPFTDKTQGAVSHVEN